jgi:hypothetical protein
MTASIEYYEPLTESVNDESTYLVVTGASRDEVAGILDVDLTNQVDENDDGVDRTGWAFCEISGGILGVEPTGFGDPSLDALRRLSEGGRAVAVVRNNVLGHLRFGCARDGEILYDSTEFMYVDDLNDVPDEIRDLFALAWDDLAGNGDPDVNGVAVAWAMAETVTGVAVTAKDVHGAEASGYFQAPSLVYSEDG